MKYTGNNVPMKCFMNQSSWLKGAKKGMKPLGILWHDTAAGNPTVKRYVQPDDNAANRTELLNILGVNKYSNDWNHRDLDKGVNAFVGQLADGTVAAVQVGPWDTAPWGCGKGKNGSCNGYDASGKWGANCWIQFEICDDGHNSITGKYTGTKEYFETVYKEACELTAYLCKLYNINPTGTVSFNGITVPTIICHKDSYRLGLGNDHSDVLKWFGQYNRTMDDVRNDVKKLLAEEIKDDTLSKDEVAKRLADLETSIKTIQTNLLTVDKNVKDLDSKLANFKSITQS